MAIATSKQINLMGDEINRCLDLSPVVKTVAHHSPTVIALEGYEIIEFILCPAAVSYDFQKDYLHSIHRNGSDITVKKMLLTL